MGENVLTTSREGAVAVLEINRPESRNSLNDELQQALGAELARLRTDDKTRVVVITGAGGVFCAGADISRLENIRSKPLVGEDGASAHFWEQLASFPKPVIAAVEGLALGGGLEIALACDIVIAAAGARFGVPEVKLGTIPGAGGTQRLPRTLGKAKAMSMLLTGDFISADSACASGIVAEVVADGEALAQAKVLAGRIARNSPLAVALAKEAALAAFDTGLTVGLQYEKRNFYVAVRSDDCHEGQAAFLEKRKPEFKGR